METKNTLVAPVLQDRQLTATIPNEMVTAQQELITWCDIKLIHLNKEVDELKAATDHAKKMKWKFTTLQNQYCASLRRLSYYGKIKAALLEGYYIVPNFPIQMFAIRTKAALPQKGYTTTFWNNHEQKAQELLMMEGEYKNPFPLLRQSTDTFGDGKEKVTYWANDWDTFEFPITMAKPSIMEATSRAMALKIFDRIGIMPEGKKDDPVIIGQVIRKSGYQIKIVSFMIAWHLDTRII